MGKRRIQNTPKIRPLTVYLLKSTVMAFGDALDPEAIVHSVPLKQGFGFSGAMYWEEGHTTPPVWKEFLAEGTEDPLAGLQNLHQSVLVLIRPSRSRRIFAFVFGYARALLKPTSYELDFGLKVVMNVVDPDKLRCLDATIFEEIPVQTRKQAGKVSALELFEVDKDADMLRSLVGVPKETLSDGTHPLLGKVIAGSSALSLRVGINFKDLGELAKALLNFYQRDDYRKHGFEWVDHLRPVRDPDLIKELDEVLLVTLQSKDPDRVSLAPPEIIEWEDYEGIRFGAGKKREPVDFQIEEFYRYMDESGDWDVDRLRSATVSLVARASGPDVRKYGLYRCLVFDHALKDEHYVFTSGNWFSIESDFAKKVSKFVSGLPEASLELPAFIMAKDLSEGDYTARVCRVNKDFALMDKKNVLPTNARTPVEVCDVFTSSRQFVHIKPYKASSTLSHLFSQGSVSADLFQIDSGYREQARRKIAQTRPALATLIPSSSGQVDLAPFEVVFAVIKKPHLGKEPWQSALPFFAQLNLMQVAHRLRLKNYRVSVKWIELT